MTVEKSSSIAKRTLPRELFSLVHHVALNESGWWGKNIQKIILSAFWISENYTVSLESLNRVLHDTFGLRISPRVIDEQIHALIGERSILQISPADYKLSENGIEKIILEIKEHLEAEKLAGDSFKTLCREVCPNLSADEQWIRFNEELLHPLVHSLGARAYELIVTDTFRLEQNPDVQAFVEGYSEKNRGNIKKLIVAFFAPKQLAARRYILRKINTYFCLEAGSLSPEMIRTIVPKGTAPSAWKLFLDSNTLFSFLGLHDKKSNETASSLLNLLHEIKDFVQVQFYVTPLTLQETSKVMKANVDLLKNIQAEENVAAPPAGLEFNGFAQKYFADNGRSFGIVTVEEYFSPYIHNLTAIVRSKGIDVYLANIEEYKSDRNVEDDIASFQPADRAAGLTGFQKEKFEHDVALWHFIKDIRPGIIESPVDAQDWILSFDRNFVSFDSAKRAAIGYGEIPVCIHPSSFIEMMHTWIPRSETFERAITNSRRLPFLMRGFDGESEAVTVKILQTLYRFEQSDQLPVDTIASIMMNAMLRNKIAAPAFTEPVRTTRQSAAPAPAAQNDISSLNEKLRVIEQLFREVRSSIQEKPDFRPGNISTLYK